MIERKEPLRRLHEQITSDYNNTIYAATPKEIAPRRKPLIRKWRLKHRAFARRPDFTFALPPTSGVACARQMR